MTLNHILREEGRPKSVSRSLNNSKLNPKKVDGKR